VLKLPRILHAFKAYYPSKGGVERLMYTLAIGHRKKFNSEVLVCKQGIRSVSEQLDGVQVQRVGTIGQLLSMPIALAYPIKFWRRARSVAIVVYHYPFPLVDLAVSLFFPKKTKLVILWHSEIVAQKKVAKWLKPLFKACLKRADKIIVSCEQMVEFSPQLANYVQKCESIPFGLDLSHYEVLSSVEQQTIASIQNRYGKFILAVGRLVSYKGFEVLIAAMREIDAHLVIIGKGPRYDDLNALIINYGLREKISILDHVDDAQLKCYYHACSVFAFPSITENEAFGLVQLEAMACAKPIVNTHLKSAVPWVARDGQEAITVEPRNVQQLAKALSELLHDEKLAYEMGQRGLARVKKTFNVEQMLAKTQRLFYQLLE